MKKITVIVISVLLNLLHYASFAQQSNETEIRNLEKMEGEAFVAKDTITLYNLLSPQFIINRPINKVGTLEDVKAMIRAGKIDIGSSEKKIEKITFINNMAIVMGDDIVKPHGAMANAGKNVTRRYTNVWIKNESGWKLTIRQATIISVSNFSQ